MAGRPSKTRRAKVHPRQHLLGRGPLEQNPFHQSRQVLDLVVQDRMETERLETERLGPDPLGPDRRGPDLLEPDRRGPDRMGTDPPGPGRMGLGPLGPDRGGTDPLGQDQMGQGHPAPKTARAKLLAQLGPKETQEQAVPEGTAKEQAARTQMVRERRDPAHRQGSKQHPDRPGPRGHLPRSPPPAPMDRRRSRAIGVAVSAADPSPRRRRTEPTSRRGRGIEPSQDSCRRSWPLLWQSWSCCDPRRLAEVLHRILALPHGK